MGFLIVVNILVFILGCFIDFFEIAFIVIPMIAPVADKLLPALLPAGTPQDLVLIWFGIIVAMNLQTSFLTPPFGFALFYLRSVAPRNDYADRVSGKTIGAVTTPQIYKGALAFIAIQLIMVVAVVVYPGIAIDTAKKEAVDIDKIQFEAAPRGYETPAPEPSASPAGAEGTATPASAKKQEETEDPMEAVRRALRDDAKK